ncbi:aldehyde dehydrogenase family protein [Paracidobacterium acidisoli]|uniref:Aldehyde dehydrogenase family protein n=1 Tax=Paracidobacterium acidisoli TaxID=2303751 RepID=A0A372IUR4_9BACT|nr:aldehyde dehydrogenase family protein [Paracidobacterium acidisoli]MBT9330135.1 aldehyde dehydrogenase family protein [Paracidobacterium acidisoli]
MERYAMFIDGEFVPAHDASVFPVYDPSTEEIIAEVPAAGSADVDRAVRAARSAFDSGAWPGTTAQERGRLLFRLADSIRQHAASLAQLEARNSGKPVVEAEFDIADTATCFEYYGGLATKILGQVNPVPDDALSLSLSEPIGVVAQIIPWNYPLLMAAWKLAPALAAGCTCVLKPAEQTPLTILELARSFNEIGFPPGAINIVTGLGADAGAPLVAHPEVDKISFTGSNATGKGILKVAADSIRRVTLELGGKSPNIFFADADFEAAVDGALFGVFINQGEVCSAGSRILVQRPIYSKFVEAMTAKAATIRLGPPLSRDTKMGPLVSRRQFERVRAYQELGKQEGKLVLGGGRASGFDRGFYIEPTIFADVSNSARIAQEEIFGPVAAVIPFDDEEDAVHIANDTPFGLAAAVWSRDIYRVFRVLKKIRAGVIWVNHMQPTYVEAPWGGYKQSGIGRELGPRGIEQYLETKQVHINLNEKPLGWY